MNWIAVQLAILGVVISLGSLNICSKLDDISKQLEKLNERGNDGNKEESNPYIR